MEEVDNQDYRSWKRSDNLIWGWILIMLTKYIVQQVLRFRTAKVVWTMLEKMFNLAKAFSQLDKVTETRLKRYQSLHKDAIKGDWENALKFIKQEPDAIRVPIMVWSETALHAAVSLHIAAGANNIEAAKLLVEKNLKLSNVQDFDGYIPLHYAAAHGNREMVLYLLDVIREDAKVKPLINQKTRNMTAIAILVKQHCSNVASVQPKVGVHGRTLSFDDLAMKVENITKHHSGGDIENPADCFIFGLTFVKQRLYAMFWEVVKIGKD
ncbi:hypothetical protein ACSBR2_007258 [Camellia fascicularis]